jgi:hypothetical protein
MFPEIQSGEKIMSSEITIIVIKIVNLINVDNRADLCTIVGRC